MPRGITNKLRNDAHYGWHWRGEGNFFEGWYFRLTLPQQCFAFMYEVSMRPNHRLLQGAVQVLGKDDQLIFVELDPRGKFALSYQTLALRYTPPAGCNGKFDLSDRQHCGYIAEDNYECAWNFRIAPLIPSWGETMGWLSYLPIFEPYWQILLPYGLAEGEVVWNGMVYGFRNAPFYAEKNWGVSFPLQWFWLQCHSFQDCHEPINLVSAGAVRQVLGRITQVAMIALWWGGKVYTFLPENSALWASVSPWGSWCVQGYNSTYRMEIEAIAVNPPALVAVPTQEGREFRCRDTGRGILQLSLWQGADRLLKVSSETAALETGGDNWQGVWQFCSERI